MKNIAGKQQFQTLFFSPGRAAEGALRRSGPVGVDIMRIAPAFDWQPVARDYLDPQAVQRIARRPLLEQPLAFAREWTRMDAPGSRPEMHRHRAAGVESGVGAKT
ncbi:MAG: hypothetical protein ABIR13_08090 [Polaromonas sp.]